MRVLVIEDDSSIRETLGIVLEAYHHQADLASNGKEALAYLERTLGNWPDVVLLDLNLLEETGEEIQERIHSRFGATPPTVVISAAQEGLRRASGIPGALFLSKPYSIDELLEIIQSAAHLSSSLSASSA
ncbi:MAG: response regulator [Bdellovibrionales bacterium]|nr:response regulator [Bdellovibrionales bacterium]